MEMVFLKICHNEKAFNFLKPDLLIKLSLSLVFSMMIGLQSADGNTQGDQGNAELINQLKSQKAPKGNTEIHPLVKVHDQFWHRLRGHQTGGNGALRKLRASTQQQISDKAFSAYIGNLRDLPEPPEKKGPLMSYLRGESQYVVQAMVIDSIPYYQELKKGFDFKLDLGAVFTKAITLASNPTSLGDSLMSPTPSQRIFRGKKYGLILQDISPPSKFNEYQFVSAYNDEAWQYFDTVANKADVQYTIGPEVEDFYKPYSSNGPIPFAPVCRSPVICNFQDVFLDTRLDIKALPNFGGVEGSLQQSTPKGVKNMPLSYIVRQQSGFLEARANEVNYKLQWQYFLTWPLYQDIVLSQQVDKDRKFVKSNLNFGLSPLHLSGNFRVNFEHVSKKIQVEWRNVF